MLYRKYILLVSWLFILATGGHPLDTDYFISSPESCPQISSQENYILNYINNQRVSAGRPPCRIDPYLSEIARHYSEHFNYDRTQPDNLDELKTELQNYGISDADVSLNFVTSGDLEKSEKIINSSDSDGLILNKENDTLGIGVKELRGFLRPTTFFTTIVSVERKVVLNKFPKTVAPGEVVKLSGYLEKDFRQPEIKMTDPDGRVKTFTVTSGPGRYFESEILFNNGPGDYSLEIEVSNRYGPSIAHILPVSAGGKTSHLTTATLSTSDEALEFSLPAEELETKLRDLVNSSRQSQGLPPLEFDPELAEVARGHSRDMLAEKKAAHILNDGLNVSDRLKNKNIFFHAVGENIAVNSSLQDAHESLLDSPAHRETMLCPDFSQMGIGLVKDPEHRQYYITEVFIKKIPILSGSGAISKILQLINEARVAKGLPEIQLHEGLTEVAGEHSRLMAAEDKIQNLLDFGKKIKKKKIRYQTAYTELVRTGQLEDITNVKACFIPKIKLIGIGAVQSASSSFGPGVFYITMIFVK